MQKLAKRLGSLPGGVMPKKMQFTPYLRNGRVKTLNFLGQSCIIPSP
jgi:hypothetical protein